MKIRDLVALAIVFTVLFALGAKALQEAKESADVTACRAKMANLSQAITKYEDAKGYLPPLYVVGRKLPGWNIRLLPYMDQSAVHATMAVHAALVEEGVYHINDRVIRDRDWTETAFDALATIPDFRCPARQPEAVIKQNTWSGVTTDYATPLIYTRYQDRWVTLTYSFYEVESPLKIYELDSRTLKWRSVRKSADWQTGKTNTLLISEKYIPDWALEEDNAEANIFNGGMQHVIGGAAGMTPPTFDYLTSEINSWRLAFLPQMAACCYLKSESPITKDTESPFTKDTFFTSRRTLASTPQQSYAWRGDYAWGSSHTGVIVAAMGDGNVRTINKNINAYTFYQLAASNVLPEPTELEQNLAEEEAAAIEANAQKQSAAPIIPPTKAL